MIRKVTALLDFASKLKAGIGPTRADWNRLIDWTTMGAPLKEPADILKEPISKSFLKSFAANLRQDIETLQSDPNKLFEDKTILDRIEIGDAIIDGSDHPKAVQIRVDYGYGHVWDILNTLIELSDLRPYLHREPENNGKFQLSFFSGEAFQAIVLELVLAISNTNGLAVCSACPRSYIPERQPMAGRRNYCPSCRADGIPVRDAAREYRKRKNRRGKKIK